MTLEQMIREAVAAGSQVHVWPGVDASVRSQGGTHHSTASGSDPIAALKAALTEDDRKRRDGVRVATRDRDPGQLDIEDAIELAREMDAEDGGYPLPPVDEFEGLL